MRAGGLRGVGEILGGPCGSLLLPKQKGACLRLVPSIRSTILASGCDHRPQRRSHAMAL